MSDCKSCQDGAQTPTNTSSAQAASAKTATQKLNTYKALLNHFWPKEARLPPAMPWLGLRVSRSAVEAGLPKYLAQLPELSAADPMSGENLEILMDFARRKAESDRGSVMMKGSEECGGCESYIEGGDYGVPREHGCEGAVVGAVADTCIKVGIDTEFPEWGPCGVTQCAKVFQYSNCTYDIVECCAAEACEETGGSE